MTRRIALMSDLHLETGGYAVPAIDADLVVLAGDILEGGAGSPVAWAKANLPPDIPVVFVPGNHDFFGMRLGKALERWRREARHSQVRVLYNEAATIAGIRVLGTPLWSGLGLWRSPIHEAGLRRILPTQIPDFSHIHQDDGKSWTVAAMLAQHKRALEFLERELPAGAPDTLVATHWPAHSGSTAARFDGNFYLPYFVNHLPHLVERAAVWMHGHVHDRFDYRVGTDPRRGRVVCNPRGHPRDPVDRSAYQPVMVEFP